VVICAKASGRPAFGAKPISSAPTPEAVSCSTPKPFQPSLTAPKSSASLLPQAARTAAPSCRAAAAAPTSHDRIFSQAFSTSAKECLPAGQGPLERIRARAEIVVGVSKVGLGADPARS